jgi:hypothetical protein
MQHSSGEAPESPKTSSLTALGPLGAVDGFPVVITGLASAPAFDSKGQLHVTVEESINAQAKLLVFDTSGHSVSGGTGFLGPEASADCVGIEGTCEVPISPLVGSDGRRFVVGSPGAGTEVTAVDAAGAGLTGWPFRTNPRQQGIQNCPPDAGCDGYQLTGPALSASDVLYLAIDAADPSTGGSLVAVGPDGTVEAGWPVVLSRSDAAFWSVIVGADGTVYAVAAEREAGFTASATILALAPDGSKRWSTTIIDP